MSWFLSILIGLLTAGCCCAAAIWVASLCVEWYRISSFEGASGYWVAAMGLLGIVFGLVVGIVTSRVAASGFLKSQGLALAVGLGVIGIVGLLARIGGDVPPRLGGEELSLQVELRCPPGVVPEYKFAVDNMACRLTSLGGGNERRRPMYGTVRWADAAEVGGQWTIPCEVFLHTRREVLVGLKVNPANDIEILLPQPAAWSEQQRQWSPWRTDRFLEEAGKPVKGFAYRFRVRTNREMQEEEKARAEAAAEAREREFAKLTADSKLEEWLVYVNDDASRGQKAREMARGRLEEAAEVLRSQDPERLRLLAVAMDSIEKLPASAEPALRRAGEVIAERARDFRASGKDDADGELVAQIRGSFYWWNRAISRVEGRRNSEFRKEVQAIQLEAGKRKEDYNWRQLMESAERALEEMDAEAK